MWKPMALHGPLRGLTGTTIHAWQTVTLVGDSQLIAVAEGYLKQIDLRQRQVAVKVQILNIDLLNDKSIDSSFSARLGDTFIVSESGRAFMNFGAYRPGNRQGTGLLANGTEYATPAEYSAGLSQVQQQKVFDPPLVAKQREVVTQSSNSGGTTSTTTLVPVLIDGQRFSFLPLTLLQRQVLLPGLIKKGGLFMYPLRILISSLIQKILFTAMSRL
jgi:type IV pilus assembly protein PilQ